VADIVETLAGQTQLKYFAEEKLAFSRNLFQRNFYNLILGAFSRFRDGAISVRDMKHNLKKLLWRTLDGAHANGSTIRLSCRNSP